MKKYKWFYVISVLLIFSCSTYPKIKSPKNENNTMLIGVINYINWSGLGEYNIKGNIEITVKSINDNKVFISKTLDDGLFYFTGLNEGIYELINITCNQSISYPIPKGLNKYFYIYSSRVNNIGFIIFENRENYSIEYINRFFEVKHKFISRFENSEWNNIVWVDVNLPLRNPFYTVKDLNGRKFLEVFNYDVSGNDKYRFIDIWIAWNILSDNEFIPYKFPENNVTLTEWIEKYIDLFPDIKFSEIGMSVTPVNEDGAIQETVELPLGISALSNVNTFQYLKIFLLNFKIEGKIDTIMIGL
jgi:hypothetical protein